MFFTEKKAVIKKRSNKRMEGFVMENIKKITEHTYGTHIYMKLEIDGKEFEVNCYLRNDGQTYKTTADGTEDREKVIEVFNQLY